MKKIKAIMAAVLLTASTSTFAIGNKDWNTFYVEWNPGRIYGTAGEALSCSFNGFSLGYSRALSISNVLPFFVEEGIGLQYSYYSYNRWHHSDWLSAKVPVGLLYAWQMPNNSITLIPHAGINLRFNIVGCEYKRFQTGWQIGLKARFNRHFILGVSYGSDFTELAKEIETCKYVYGENNGSPSTVQIITKSARKIKTKGASITLGYTF